MKYKFAWILVPSSTFSLFPIFSDVILLIIKNRQQRTIYFKTGLRCGQPSHSLEVLELNSVLWTKFVAMSPNFKTLCWWWQFCSTIENNLDKFCERNKGSYIPQITIREAKTIRCIELWVIFKANILFGRFIWICLTFEGNSDFNFTKYVRDWSLKIGRRITTGKRSWCFFSPPLASPFSWLKGKFPSKLVFFCIWSTVRSVHWRLILQAKRYVSYLQMLTSETNN